MRVVVLFDGNVVAAEVDRGRGMTAFAQLSPPLPPSPWGPVGRLLLLDLRSCIVAGRQKRKEKKKKKRRKKKIQMDAQEA